MNETGQRSRVAIEHLAPEIDGGRFPIKRTTGETVDVQADAFVDGHDLIAVVLLSRYSDAAQWHETPMSPLGNDRWHAAFAVPQMGTCFYTVRAWIDRFGSWRRDFRKRLAASQNVDVDRMIGGSLIEDAAGRTPDGNERAVLQGWVRKLRDTEHVRDVAEICEDDELARLMNLYSPRAFATTYHRELAVTVESERARFSTWYEMFPRSTAAESGRHGTFQDCEARLPYIAAMGFDVLYLPPIHPIGVVHRKGKNNAPEAAPDDVGSPWAIGSAQGGHKSIHPQLGTLEDFQRLTAAARDAGLALALDIALQCAPDHPYVTEHPEWFLHRPDGTIQYAENPPKKYQDIYPLNFECEQWEALWNELKSIFEYWAALGVRIFRVDNPHTKPFVFWEWVIDEVRRKYPDAVFLSEAFTRPKVMYRLAKLGFSQSYTYFAWRGSKRELTDYLTEITQSPVADFFRPNLWPNTPDILTEQLQVGGRNLFLSRLVLAATLGANYGIYGPAFELGEREPRESGSEEYLNSEKYQIRHWDLDAPENLNAFIGRVNQIRRENAALQGDRTLQFHAIENEALLCYSKHTGDFSNVVVTVVNLDPNYTQAGVVELDLAALGVDDGEPYQMHDVLSGARYLWHGRRNYLELNPHVSPAHIFRMRRRVRTERDFDYYL